MFSKPMVWILVCSPWDLTCFSNPNPTSEIWPKLDGSIKKEQESFRSQMSSVFLGAGSDAHHESHECNENQHKKILCRVVQGSSNYHIFKFWGNQTIQSIKCVVVILRDFHYNNALFGLVSYHDPCCSDSVATEIVEGFFSRRGDDYSITAEEGACRCAMPILWAGVLVNPHLPVPYNIWAIYSDLARPKPPKGSWGREITFLQGKIIDAPSRVISMRFLWNRATEQ